MLNISDNKISNVVRLKDFNSYKLLRRSHIRRLSLWLLIILGGGFLLCLFLPWVQNIDAKGYVTTRSPEQRPQAIQSVISGRLEDWFVKEGDFVEKGDTIVFISEVKSEYFDPDLLARTAEQIDAKAQSVESYDQKIIALQKQYQALRETLKLKRQKTRNKMQQARNKIKIDSIDLVAYRTNLKIVENQLARTQELYDKGLKTLTELQEKQYKVQSVGAKVNVQKNKLLNQKNVFTNLQIELITLEREYAEKLAKSQSDRQSALSAKLESVAATSKLRNKYSNYSQRQKLYYITAPQPGYITKTIKKGIGGTVKAGTDIATVMPAKYDLAVEVYVKPQDVSLLSLGNLVQLRFDGWPAIVVSGWPKSSTGVFLGKLVAIDKFISDNGYYRVLISPHKIKKDWPNNLSIGTGASAFILLKEVAIWYEIWRQLNGFPPNYYKSKKSAEDEVKLKAPLKSVQ